MWPYKRHQPILVAVHAGNMIPHGVNARKPGVTKMHMLLYKRKSLKDCMVTLNRRPTQAGSSLDLDEKLMIMFCDGFPWSKKTGRKPSEQEEVLRQGRG